MIFSYGVFYSDNIQANLVEAADSIVRRVADGFREASKGIVKIPDTKHGLHTASKGTFS